MFLDGLEDAYDRGKLMGNFAEDCASRYQFSRAAQDNSPFVRWLAPWRHSRTALLRAK